MKKVLDTNVLKKMSGPKRNANIDKWLLTVDDLELYLTTLSLQEMQKGIELLRKRADPAKVSIALQLERELDVLVSQFGERILPLDAPAAREWGRRLAKQGTKDANDLGIISIVATQPDAVAVTRNLNDFRHKGIKVLNPYDDPPSLYDDPET